MYDICGFSTILWENLCLVFMDENDLIFMEKFDIIMSRRKILDNFNKEIFLWKNCEIDLKNFMKMKV